MSTLDHALSLAARGFYVFPILPVGTHYRDAKGEDQVSDGKHPAVNRWQHWATRNENKIRRKWETQDFNIGISTSRFGDGQALIAIDVDMKKGKNGETSLFALDLEGYELPATYEQSTPNNGRHLVYVSSEPARQGVDVLGPGLDVRSAGGYVVGAGSTIGGRAYAQVNGHALPAPAPAWLIERLGRPRTKDPDAAPVEGVDPDRALERGQFWLENFAPIAIEGQGGDITTFKVAAELKDKGCSQDQALELMSGWWNDQCLPPWAQDELATKVRSAYRYGNTQQGALAPEAVFDEAEVPEDEGDEGRHPFDVLNAEYAYIKQGAFVLQETTDAEGRYTTQHLELKAFHTWHANQPFQVGKKTIPISQAWIESPRRRQYEGVTFAPEQDPGPRWFNLWRGFATKPASSASHPAVEQFKEHALKNVCNNDPQLYHWLMGYFAHMIQKPSEKPLVALVFRGKKGTGKNALMDRVGALLGDHYMVADDDRFLLSNFNAHLETSLCLVLDEAAWAGDKKAEGRLKGLITGDRHNIERKGREIYRTKNLTRVAIIGNEDWLVPASQDERRFAVFNLGEGRMQDREFFKSMREGMEQGGYAHLLKFFQDFDLSGVDVNDAPRTQALQDQKLASLGAVHLWWYDCLTDGQLQGADFSETWQQAIPTNRFRAAFNRWAKERGIRDKWKSDKAFIQALRCAAPSIHKRKSRPDNPADTTYAYHNPGLEALRLEWDRFLGGTTTWE